MRRRDNALSLSGPQVPVVIQNKIGHVHGGHTRKALADG